MAKTAEQTHIPEVEDEPIVCQSIRTILLRDGASGGGIEARDLLCDDPSNYGLVIIDIFKPKVSGIDLIKRLGEQGIDQVNRAVAEMGKVIQQNAANAEGSASASEEMASQEKRNEKSEVSCKDNNPELVISLEHDDIKDFRTHQVISSSSVSVHYKAAPRRWEPVFMETITK